MSFGSATMNCYVDSNYLGKMKIAIVTEWTYFEDKIKYCMIKTTQ